MPRPCTIAHRSGRSRRTVLRRPEATIAAAAKPAMPASGRILRHHIEREGLNVQGQGGQFRNVHRWLQRRSTAEPRGPLGRRRHVVDGVVLSDPDVGTSTEASDPAGMSHLRNVRARQPRRRCVRSEAGPPAARVRVVLSLAPVRGPGYNFSRTNDVPTAERAGSYARGCDACVARVAMAATLGILRSQDGEAEWACAAQAANG